MRSAEDVTDDGTHGSVVDHAEFQRWIELIGRRWSGAIIRALHGGPRRFSDVLDSVPGLSDRLLSERLRQLEAEGLVQREVFPETPVRIEYGLTAQGRELEPVFRALDRWAARWKPD